MSLRLEGLPRHTSMHAAGVVISQKSVDEYVPLSRGSDGSVTTQFTMTTLEELGLLKMDFLGLRTLTVIQDAVKNVARSTGKELDMDQIDYNDPDVLASIGTGQYRWCVPAGECRYEKLHEGTKTTESGRYYCRNFPVSSGTDGLCDSFQCPISIDRFKSKNQVGYW